MLQSQVSTLLPRLLPKGIQIREQQDWVIFSRIQFDLITDGEPYVAQNFFYQPETGKYLARVWNVTTFKGEVKGLEELEFVLTKTFQDTLPCQGYLAVVREVQSDCDLTLPGSASSENRTMCKTCQPSVPVVKNEPIEQIVTEVKLFPEQDAQDLNHKDESMLPAKVKKEDFFDDSDIADDDDDDGDYEYRPKKKSKPLKTGNKPRSPKEAKFACNLCKEGFQGLVSYCKHMNEMHPEVNELFCKICDKAHPKEGFIDTYKKCVKTVKPFHCDQCGQFFSTKCRLNDHYNGHHSHQKLYKCDECGMTTYHATKMHSHKKVHKRERREVVFSCEFCGKEFCNKNYLTKHIRLFHEMIDDNVHCDKCDKTFTRYSTYRSHVNVHHSDDPKFACGECGKRFDTVLRRKMHERIHQGLTTIPTIPCPHCGKEVVKKNMPAHIRTHTGEKPYKCPDCDYCCVSSTALSLHRRRHRKEAASP